MCKSTFEYKVTSERCSTVKLLKNDLNTNLSFALNKKSISTPDNSILIISKSESQTRIFILDKCAECENFTAPGGTGVSDFVLGNNFLILLITDFTLFDNAFEVCVRILEIMLNVIFKKITSNIIVCTTYL